MITVVCTRKWTKKPTYFTEVLKATAFIWMEPSSLGTRLLLRKSDCEVYVSRALGIDWTPDGQQQC